MSNNIDTMKMVRAIRDKQYEATKKKSFKELIEYFRSKANKLYAELDSRRSLAKTR